MDAHLDSSQFAHLTAAAEFGRSRVFWRRRLVVDVIHLGSARSGHDRSRLPSGGRPIRAGSQLTASTDAHGATSAVVAGITFS